MPLANIRLMAFSVQCSLLLEDIAFLELYFSNEIKSSAVRNIQLNLNWTIYRHDWSYYIRSAIAGRNWYHCQDYFGAFRAVSHLKINADHSAG